MLVYNYLKSLCNNCDIAEELTQETFYKAIKGIDKFNNECKVSTWLCKIAKNTWIDFLRKKEKENFISIDNEEVIQNFFSSKSIKNNIEDSEDIINLYKYIHTHLYVFIYIITYIDKYIYRHTHTYINENICNQNSDLYLFHL